MNLRPMLWSVVAVVAGGLLGCGQQPKYYRVAVDQAPLNNLPASCYTGGTTPAPTSNNMADVQQWVLWDGVEGRQYLQVGTIRVSLGDASTIDIPGDAVVSTGEGDETTFVAERTVSNPSRTYRATYTFDEEGSTIEGTIALSSTCSGAGCDRPNCEASLRFVGRQVEADQEVLLNSGASN